MNTWNAVCVDAGSPEYEQDKDRQDDEEKQSDDEADEPRAEKRPHSDDDDDGNDSDRASKRSRSDVDDADNANSRHSGSDSEIFGSDEDWLSLTDRDLTETVDIIGLRKIK